jgi:hypothetical protein
MSWTHFGVIAPFRRRGAICARDIHLLNSSLKLTLQPTTMPTTNDYQLGRKVSATVWMFDRLR